MSSKRRNKKRMIMEKRKTGENMMEGTNMMEQEQKSLEQEELVQSQVSAAEPEKPQPKVSPVTESEKPAAVTVDLQGQAAESNSVLFKKEIEKNLYLQYNNLEFSDRLMFEASINDYCQKAGIPVEEIASVNLYVKPEEGKAYYVINNDGDKTGFIDL